MKIALISLDQRWHDKDANFSRATDLVGQRGVANCELAIFPEMTLTGYSLEVDLIAEPESCSPTLARFGTLAAESGMAIIFGACLVNADTGRARNRLCVATPDGSSRAVYAKVHPFSYVGEDKVLEAGSEIATIRLGALDLGASICYDLRFPELFAAMAATCNAAIAIASWPARRVADWRALLVARAIENQFFMIGVNRIGTDGNGISYEKSTMLVGPDGTILEPAVPGAEVDVYEFDPDTSRRYRAEFPTLRDKRPNFYSESIRRQ